MEPFVQGRKISHLLSFQGSLQVLYRWLYRQYGVVVYNGVNGTTVQEIRLKPVHLTAHNLDAKSGSNFKI